MSGDARVVRTRGEIILALQSAVRMLLTGEQHSLRELFGGKFSRVERGFVRKLAAGGTVEPVGAPTSIKRAYRMANTSEASARLELLVSDGNQLARWLWPSAPGPVLYTGGGQQTKAQNNSMYPPYVQRIVPVARAALRLLSDGEQHSARELFSHRGLMKRWQKRMLDALLHEQSIFAIGGRHSTGRRYQLGASAAPRARLAALLQDDRELRELLWPNGTPGPTPAVDDVVCALQSRFATISADVLQSAPSDTAAPPTVPAPTEKTECDKPTDEVETKINTIIEILGAWAEAHARLEEKIDALCDVWDLFEADEEKK